MDFLPFVGVAPRRLWVLLGTGVLMFGSSALVVLAESGDLIGRLGVDVRGKTEGSVRLLAGDEFAIGAAAQIKGGVLLPILRDPGNRGPTNVESLSPRLQLVRSALEVNRINANASESFNPPELQIRRVHSKGEGVSVRANGSTGGRVSTGSDLAVELRLESFALPPGDYGHLVIREACVVLGAPDPSQRSNYAFHSISIAKGGRLDLAGPVNVDAGELRQLDGCLGKPRFTDWLDLRIGEQTTQVVIHGELHAALYAPNTAIILDAGARVEGWLLGERVTVHEKASFKAREIPDMPGNPVMRRAPLSRKLFNLESGLAASREAVVPGYSATYREGVLSPVLRIDPAAGSSTPIRPENAFREATFRALCHAFIESNLPEVTIDMGQRGTVDRLSLHLTKEQFLASIQSLASKSTLPERLAEVAESPLRLNLLVQLLVQQTKMVSAPAAP
jgi:hypothetical protein